MVRRKSRYIHQLPGWPDLHWRQADLAAPLAAARYRQGRLISRMEALGFPLRQEASLRTLTLDVLKSSEIEGRILDPGQVRSSIARRLRMDIGGLVPSGRDVEGVVDMMLDATRHFDRPLTAARLRGWQAALFPLGSAGRPRMRVGAWRDDAKGPMQVVSGAVGHEHVHYEAPAAGRIDAEMAGFLDWVNRRDGIDPVLRAAGAHFRFVTIHPFDYANDLIARAIADWALARSEASPQRFYSMSSQIRLERKDYYAVLERTQKGPLDITGWMSWFLGCLDRALSRTETALAAVFRKERFWKAHAGAALNTRQRMILNRMQDGFEGKLTSSKWAKLAKCSQDTAQRDILGLMEQGILAKDAAGGRSTSYSLRV